MKRKLTWMLVIAALALLLMAMTPNEPGDYNRGPIVQQVAPTAGAVGASAQQAARVCMASSIDSEGHTEHTEGPCDVGYPAP